MLRRHPLSFVGGLILLAVLLPAGYLYWDYASHFESTDDAFIAAGVHNPSITSQILRRGSGRLRLRQLGHQLPGSISCLEIHCKARTLNRPTETERRAGYLARCLS